MLIYNSEEGGYSPANNFRFNMLLYASMLATYFVIIYTNLSNTFFLLLPFIIIPQLYRNAYRGPLV